MANPDFPRGLQPYGNLLRSTEYSLSAAYAQDLFIGDPVITLAGGRDVGIATAGTGFSITGAILGIYDLDKVPLNYWDSGHAGIGYVIVADHPDQIFIGQSNGATLALVDANGNVNLAAGGGGSTVNFRSSWEIEDTDTGGATPGDQIRLLKPDQRVDNIVATSNTDWLFRINNHTENAGIVGVGV